MKDRKALTPAERLIVAADFKPLPWRSGRTHVENKVTELADALKGTGVCIKVNSALRVYGYHLIEIIHDHELKVFADLKLNDIPETLATDGEYLHEVKPELLTVMCSATAMGMSSLKKALPATEILGVTVLTTIKTENLIELGYPNSVSLDVVVRAMAETARKVGLGGVICSAKEAGFLREVLGGDMTINTPAIRPAWAIVPGDDQNPERIMTPAKAIQAGADRIVVGRPILQAKNPCDAVKRTLDEIEAAMNV